MRTYICTKCVLITPWTEVFSCIFLRTTEYTSPVLPSRAVFRITSYGSRNSFVFTIRTSWIAHGTLFAAFSMFGFLCYFATALLSLVICNAFFGLACSLWPQRWSHVTDSCYDRGITCCPNTFRIGTASYPLED